MTKIEPMLAESSDNWEEVFNASGYAYEIKYDGVRCIVEVDNNDVSLWSRTSKPLTNTFPEVTEAVRRMVNLNNITRLVLDGEIVAYKDGEVSFNQVQQRLGIKDAARIRRLAQEIPAKFVAFDILDNGVHFNLHTSTYQQRHMMLESLQVENHILISKVYTDGRQLLHEIREKGIEGIMAKRINGQYHYGKRNAAWVKIKPVDTADCIVCGYTMGTGKRNGMIGALVLEQLDKSGKPVFVGKVGTGFNDKQLSNLTAMLSKLISDTSQEWRREVGEEYHGIPSELRPVCEVEYLMKSKDGILRFPSFKCIRTDKPAKDCVTL